MKKFILALMLVSTTSAFAQVWPRVINYGNHVNVNIWNPYVRPVTCTGWIYITNLMNRTDSIHFSAHLRPMGSVNRNYYPRDPGGRIRHVHHNIWCR